MTAVTRHLIEQHGLATGSASLAGPKDAPDAAETAAGIRAGPSRPARAAAIAQVIHGDFSEGQRRRGGQDPCSAARSLPQAVVCAERPDGHRRACASCSRRACGSRADVAVTGFDDVHASRVNRPAADHGQPAVPRTLAAVPPAGCSPGSTRPSLTPAVQVLPHPSRLFAPACGCQPRQQRLGRLKRPPPGRRFFMRSHLITPAVAVDQSMGNTETGRERDRRPCHRGTAGPRSRRWLALGPAAVLAAVARGDARRPPHTVPAAAGRAGRRRTSDSFLRGRRGPASTPGWTYDTGTPVQRGRLYRELRHRRGREQHQLDPPTCRRDGSGHLNITAVKSGTSWTSGRIETTGGQPSRRRPAARWRSTASIRPAEPG